MNLEKIPGVILGRPSSQGFHMDAMRVMSEAAENAGGEILNPWVANYDYYQEMITRRAYFGLIGEMNSCISRAWFAIGEASFPDTDLGSQLEKVISSRRIPICIFRHESSPQKSLAIDGRQLSKNFNLVIYKDDAQLTQEVQKFINGTRNYQTMLTNFRNVNSH